MQCLREFSHLKLLFLSYSMQPIRARTNSDTTIKTTAVELCEFDYPFKALTIVRRSQNYSIRNDLIVNLNDIKC